MGDVIAITEQIDIQFIAELNGPQSLLGKPRATVRDLKNVVMLRAKVFIDGTYEYIYASVIPGAMDFDGHHYEIVSRMQIAKNAPYYETTKDGRVSSTAVIYYDAPPSPGKREKYREQIRTWFKLYMEVHGQGSILTILAEHCIARARGHQERLDREIRDGTLRIEALKRVADSVLPSDVRLAPEIGGIVPRPILGN